jgi:hypothetical protein
MDEFNKTGYSRAQVLDGNHGIERINYGLSGSVYLPWYYSQATLQQHYYTSEDGLHRIEYPTWLEAFDHIARSRRMLTSKHIGSNYAQEAKQVGVDVPTSATPDVETYRIKHIHTGHMEEVFEVQAGSLEEAQEYVNEHHLELDPISSFPLRDQDRE